MVLGFFGSSTKKVAVSEMRRGMGGRLEEAFAAAKESGKAAFVSFVTAGYPAAEGECPDSIAPFRMRKTKKKSMIAIHEF